MFGFIVFLVVGIFCLFAISSIIGSILSIFDNDKNKD